MTRLIWYIYISAAVEGKVHTGRAGIYFQADRDAILNFRIPLNPTWNVTDTKLAYRNACDVRV
ncbi:MAG: hypothetical protein N2235_02845 [Fischerella sp.]|nr:hypothetical protein [Fischerella sp.]